MSGVLTEGGRAAVSLPAQPECREPPPYLAHTISDDGRELLIHRAFEVQAARNPEAPAILDGQWGLSYGALNARANQVAHRLIAMGIRPDDRVVICAERSPDMVAGVLGILKAGGAYVPLDPGYPPDRLAFMVEDSASVAAIGHRDALRLLPLSMTATIVFEDMSAAPFPAFYDPYVPDLSGANLAYIIYTSGSTGRPKGVMVEHGGVVNFLRSMAEAPGLSAQDTVLALTTLSFDIAGLEIYLPLSRGARLAIASRDQSTDGRRLIELIDRYSVTVMQATPATWRLLLESGWAGRANLKVLSGGEALSPVLASRLVERVAEVWNLYGPTETTIWSTLARITSQSGEVDVTIGRPIANTDVYILDENDQLSPAGTPGEIVIGGAGVARGYFNRPELTAQKFTPDPFRDTPRSRLYRTGDVGKWRSDGNLVYLGRSDHQVKIRGFRIELGEIEVALGVCPEVREAAVVVHDLPGDGESRLIAYVVFREGMRLSAASMRKRLSERLPKHMIPSAFVLLDRLPLMPNGKLDRAALRAPDHDDVASLPYEAPIGEVEEALEEVWRQLLGLDRIGRHDDFFDLGGHSLLTVRVVVALESRDIRIAAIDLWISRTIAVLAQRIASGQVAVRVDRALCIRKGDRRRIFCPHDGISQLMYVPVIVGDIGPDIGIYGLPAQPEDEMPLPTVEAMAKRLIDMVRGTQPGGPYHLIGYSFGGLLAYEMAAQLIEAGEEIGFLGMIDAQHHVAGTSSFERNFERMSDDMKILLFLNSALFKYKEVRDSLQMSDMKNVNLTSSDSVLRYLFDKSILPSPYNLLSFRQLRQVIYRACYYNRAQVRYRGKSLPGPVHLFVSDDNAENPEASLGWEGIIPSGMVRVIPMSGTHLSLMMRANAAGTAAKVAQAWHGALHGAPC